MVPGGPIEQSRRKNYSTFPQQQKPAEVKACKWTNKQLYVLTQDDTIIILLHNQTAQHSAAVVVSICPPRPRMSCGKSRYEGILHNLRMYSIDLLYSLVWFLDGEELLFCAATTFRYSFYYQREGGKQEERDHYLQPDRQSLTLSLSACLWNVIEKKLFG